MGEEDDKPKTVGLKDWEPMVDALEGAFGLDRSTKSPRFMPKEPGMEMSEEDTQAIESLHHRVAAMRRFGVVKWNGIELGAEPRGPVTPIKARPMTKSEVHLDFWSKLRRSSGARMPPCSAKCACGAWRMSDVEDGDLGD
jgi:hypothetical protein